LVIDNKGMIVTIIDSNDTDRRSGFINAFKGGATCQLFYRDEGVNVCRNSDKKNIDQPEPPHITFLHIRDRVLINDDQRKLEYGEIENTVFYGGNGGDDPEIPSNAKERIWRPLSGGARSLSQDEAKQLCEYFNRPPKERIDKYRPDILRCSIPFVILSTLSVLCQGYLTVIANYKQETNGIDQNLRDKWCLGDKIHVDDNKLKIVQRPEWWLDVFGVIKEGSDEIAGGKWNSLIEGSEKEIDRSANAELKNKIKDEYEQIKDSKSMNLEDVSTLYDNISACLKTE